MVTSHASTSALEGRPGFGTVFAAFLGDEVGRTEVFMASGTEEGVAKSQDRAARGGGPGLGPARAGPRAPARLAEELMQKYLWDSPRNPQAQLCAGLLRSLQDGQAGAPGPLPPGTDPAVAALLQSMTAASGAAGASPSAAGPDMAALLSSLGAGQGVS
ncbi:unnamed protein product [Prorocentrum cordatum]|uniref:Uncharacterized protein n=1 Tax=Prorocentrum cordatum TaxID=2364126 RepID=A0ABN9X7M6_9DINO|nr:unnamed protein product [Polarella glacialis]